MKSSICCFFVIITILFSGHSIGFCEASGPEYENTKKLISLVNEAAALMEQRGELAFVEFRNVGSKWCHGETYIFVLDMDGNCVVHPDPALVGKNMMNLKDVNGKAFVRSFLRKASGKDREGWTHYSWPKPKSFFPTWKSVYSKRTKVPDGHEYAVSCGLYNMKMERMFVIEVVNDAIELLENEGKAAYNKFRSKSSDFYFLDTYLFIIDDQGNLLVDPPFPYLEGRNMHRFRDQKGKYAISEMIATVKARGSGWVDYMWPKPGDYVPAKKSSFVKGMKLNGQLLIVGSGIYLD